MLSGAKVYIKTKKGCFKGHIKTCEDYCKKPEEICSFSHGRYFNRGNDGKHWPEGITSVQVGTMDSGELVRGEEEDQLPATTPERRALFQAATLILSAAEQGISLNTYLASLPQDVEDAYNCIVDYYTDGTPNCDLQQAAGTIGDWIDENHCED